MDCFKIVIGWINKHLAARGSRITNLTTDLQDGLCLIHVLFISLILISSCCSLFQLMYMFPSFLSDFSEHILFVCLSHLVVGRSER
jgi:hypothetical protein